MGSYSSGPSKPDEEPCGYFVLVPFALTMSVPIPFTMPKRSLSCTSRLPRSLSPTWRADSTLPINVCRCTHHVSARWKHRLQGQSVLVRAVRVRVQRHPTSTAPPHTLHHLGHVSQPHVDDTCRLQQLEHAPIRHVRQRHQPDRPAHVATTRNTSTAERGCRCRRSP